MVYNGKPYQNGWFGCTSFFWNAHIALMPIFRGGDFLLVFFWGIVTGSSGHFTTKNPGEGYPSRARSDLQWLGEFIAPGVWSGDRDWHRGEGWRFSNLKKKTETCGWFDLMLGGAFFFFVFLKDDVLKQQENGWSKNNTRICGCFKYLVFFTKQKYRCSTWILWRGCRNHHRLLHPQVESFLSPNSGIANDKKWGDFLKFLPFCQVFCHQKKIMHWTGWFLDDHLIFSHFYPQVVAWNSRVFFG